MVEFDELFDPTEHFSKSLGPIPEGKYVARVVHSSVNSNSQGTGKNLKLVFEIDGEAHPEYRNRKVFEYYVREHSQYPDAVRIANGKLASLCRAMRITKPIKKSEDLHDVPVVIQVIVQESSGDYPPDNKIQSYHPVKE